MTKREATWLIGGSVAVLLCCGGDPGDLLIDAGDLLQDAGDLVGDGGGDGDAHAATPTEIPATCSTNYVHTMTYDSGFVYKQTHRYAVVDVGDPDDLPAFWVITCYPAGGAPACPSGASCSGSYPPSFYGSRCYLAREGGTFVDGMLHVSCGSVYESTPSGGPTTVSGAFATSLRVLVD
jgi:hypothetical protein